MTVGQEIARRTGFALFHNHLSIEAVLPVFDFGEPAFNRLVTLLRREVISEAAKSDLPGLIFTFVWAFDAPNELDYVTGLVRPFEREGGRVVFVELWADLDVRCERNETANRLAEKPSKRDVQASRRRLLEAEDRWTFRSEGAFPLQPHLFIDNSTLTPAEVAARIIEHFELPTGDSP